MASNGVKEYANDDITITWEPDKCMHSEKCWRGLGAVFNPKVRPWINVNGADADTIRKQIDQCPSGALGYKGQQGGTSAASSTEEIIVELAPNGPLMVYGNLTLKDKEGNETKHHKTTAFCRCGASSNKPFCDGSHQKIDFKG